MPDRDAIWYLINSLEVGGTERTLVDLVNGLDRNRFAPTVWTITDDQPLATEVNEDVPVRSLGARHKLDVAAVARFAVAVRRRRPAILQSFLFFDNVLGRLASTVSPTTTVISGIRAVPNSPSKFRTAVDGLTEPLSDIVISNSGAGADYAIDHGVPPQKVRVVRNGRDVTRFASAEAPESLRTDIDVPQDAPVVGTVGRLIERKGHYDLLEAWPRVLRSHPEAHLVIVGDGPERAGLRSQCDQLDISDSVRLLGRREDVPALLSTFDLFAFPSHFEGLPGALLEAMAAGLPIVCTPVDGNSELVVDGEHGIHVPVGNAEQFAAAVSELLGNHERSAALAERARRRAEADFTVTEMVSNYSAIYEDVLSR